MPRSWPLLTRRQAEQDMPSVVIVDDQEINLRILSRFAERLGRDVTVRTFTNPATALEHIAAATPDLIVTDFVMPEITGEEFIRRCRTLLASSEVPIIVVTAYEDQEFRYRALDSGATDFLLSPVDGREFCIRARNLLTMHSHQQRVHKRASLLESELADALRQHAQELQSREEKMRRVINTVPALVRATDAEGRLAFVNDYHQQFFDINPETAVGGTQGTLFGNEYAARHHNLDNIVLNSGATLRGVEETILDLEGRSHVMLTTKAPLSASNGRVDHVVTVSLDITERKLGEQAVRESEERFRRLIEGSVLGIVIEKDGHALFANATFAQIFGYAHPDEILALPGLDSLFPKAEHRRIKRLKSEYASTQAIADRIELEGLKQDETLIWVEIQVQEVWWKGEQVWQWTVADITLRKAYEERLQRQANFDAITGLPNRILALDRLRGAVVSGHRHNHKVGVLFIDLDHFKKINDTLGHATGDQLLKLAADRLSRCVREEDTVARLGGDEFTVILPNIIAPAHAEPVIHKILNAFSLPFHLDRHEAFVTASIGITIFPDDTEDPQVLMQNADAAMYRAKEQGRNTFQFFTPELNQRAMERMRIEGHLLHALDRNEFSLHYQPIVDLRSGNLIGAEALLRWSNAELGTISPDRFIPLAEDTGLIVPIGRWVLNTACRQLTRWRSMGLPPLRVSVNVSSRQFRGKDLVGAVTQALNDHAVAPPWLELEITEGLLMDELPHTKETLRELDTLGIRFALDDFGTGYSSLSYLKQFPVDTVKIDQSFIRDVSTDPSDATVVEAIIAMANRLNVEVVAEGVETPQQAEFIRGHGCDMAQGYYFSKPLTPEQFSAWAKDRLPPRRRAL
jgi:diguanylate cyclase (GGDEF)-like protein/PAS domain S-box-containing protein